jgi:hypothetical protein
MSDDEREEIREMARHINRLMHQSAESFILAARGIVDHPDEVEATFLINEMPPDILEEFKAIASFNAWSLTTEQLHQLLLLVEKTMPYMPKLKGGDDE